MAKSVFLDGDRQRVDSRGNLRPQQKENLTMPYIPFPGAYMVPVDWLPAASSMMAMNRAPFGAVRGVGNGVQPGSNIPNLGDLINNLTAAQTAFNLSPADYTAGLEAYMDISGSDGGFMSAPAYATAYSRAHAPVGAGSSAHPRQQPDLGTLIDSLQQAQTKFDLAPADYAIVLAAYAEIEGGEGGFMSASQYAGAYAQAHAGGGAGQAGPHPALLVGAAALAYWFLSNR
jgi:hypothetical protein